MVYVSALAPALLLSVTGALATTAAASALPTSSSVGNSAADSGPPHILFSEDATTISYANTDTDADTDADTDDTDTDTSTGFEPFDPVQHKGIHRCNRSPLRCDCSKNATELAALNALRHEKNCAKCSCHKNGAGHGVGGSEGQLVKSVVAAVVGVAGVVALL
ncbi:predicted protein [Chaetomium globosum CBS 148.51]|uniref:Uncharacterized protein n=1 Tax=Chaetomium globosum (strain ATCC 6205 / CBS 148.51 / DSM 1962 / NBRC 6347 / NRRL 1970) TaxID=306901 RepID=Q2H3L8_CHAGB|nr:uncharacterized protein CHGG_06747 [Chaetomium globosum CBS 148.51]EAQ90128.1 predicted protein [Chaetomium globosum CBS 148.51]